jgi:hypothetical protein
VRISTFTRGYATYYIGAIFNHLLGMKAAFGASEALYNNFRIFINQYAHSKKKSFGKNRVYLQKEKPDG